MNRRQDRYGGDRAGRTLFPREVLLAVRGAIGSEAILGIRIPGDELVEGGIDADEAAAIAQDLVGTGEVDYVSVTSGNNTRKLARVDHWPPTPAPFGAFRHLSRRVRQTVRVPVATVGRVTTLALAEEILAAGDADLVGMVRANVADPDLLPKSRAGRADTVRPCIGANVCINGLLEHKPLACMANPDVGRPGVPIPTGWGRGRAAVVVGAGPAGLEAARRLAIGGWRTVLVERSRAVGGQMALWSRTPSRREFLKLVEWWAADCARLGETAEVGLVSRLAPDLVVVATGSAPVAGLVPPADAGVAALGPYDAPPAGGHVVVRDEMGRLPALLTAERFAQSARVTLVTSLLHPGEGEGITTLYPLLRDLAGQGVAIVDRAKVVGVEGRSVRLVGTFGEPRPAIEEVDALVSLVGVEPVADLAAPLRSAGFARLVVGDAHLPRDVAGAVSHAARAIAELVERPAAAA